MEGAPSPVLGPGPLAAQMFLPLPLHFFCQAQNSRASASPASIFWGTVFLVMGVPVGPLPVQPMGLLTPALQALIQVRRSVLLAGVGQAPSLLPKTTGLFPKRCWELQHSTVGECQSGLGEMYPVSITSPVQACCIYAVIFQLVSRKFLYTALPTADSRELLVLLVITIIVLMRRVARPAVTSCSWPAGLWVRCIMEREQIDLAHGSHHLWG